MIYKVLIADDERSVLDGFEYQLKSYDNIQPVFANSAADAIKAIERDPKGFAAVVLDYHFEEEKRTGADLAKQMFKQNPDLQIIICTGDNTRATLLESFRAEVRDLVDKNDIHGFIVALHKCFQVFDEHYRIICEQNKPLKARWEDNRRLIAKMGIVGRSDSMREVCEIIENCKNEKATVLIKGESGTGKELVARAIHDQSSRKSHKFIAINCGSIPHHLIESELFGHVRGAFTGAVSNSVGKFELADKGTLFLDEIGDMPIDLQVKLLRALQEGTFFPVGSRDEVRVDVRVVAATNVDLPQAIKNKQFREDLYYRLNVVQINLPPLRERQEDIEPLVLHFQNKYAKNSDKKILYKTLEPLVKYPWPGNIRELENTIESLFILYKKNDIGPEDLPHHFFDDVAAKGALTFEKATDYPTFYKELEKFISEKEAAFLHSKVKAAPSIRHAAKALKISRTTLQRKLAEGGFRSNDIEPTSEAQ